MRNSYFNYPLPIDLINLKEFEMPVKVMSVILLGILLVSFLALAIFAPSVSQPLVSPLP